MKRCTKCGEEKESTDFYSDKRTKDRLKSECKKCHLKAFSRYFKTDKGKKAHAKGDAKYSRTEKGKTFKAKHTAKRKRDLGFVLINHWFPGCQMHHLNETYVLAIPASLHRKYYHNHKDLQSMEEINHVAISWYYSY